MWTTVPSPSLCLRISGDIGTLFCPKVIIHYFWMFYTQSTTAKSIQHLSKIWMVQNVASNVTSQAIAGFWRLSSGSIVRGFRKSSLFSITVCGQLNNFNIISFIGELCIDFCHEFSLQSQFAMCRRPRFMVDLKTHFSSDYLKYQQDFVFKSAEEELQLLLLFEWISASRKARRHACRWESACQLMEICMIIRHAWHLHDAYVSHCMLPPLRKLDWLSHALIALTNPYQLARGGKRCQFFCESIVFQFFTW